MTDASPGQRPAGARKLWQLRVLGGFRLTDEAGAEAPLGRLDQALLAYLVLSRHPRYPRAKLATLLWPERSEATRSLTVSLSTVRHALRDGDGVMLPLKSDPLVCHLDEIEVDALVFEKLVAEGTPEALEQAQALYVGDLLEGFDIRSDEFNDWLMQERIRLQGLAIDCQCRLMKLREAARHWQKALDTARRVLGRDRVNQDAHRTIMRVHMRSGQPGAARAHAQYCEDLLQREKVDPDSETRRLFAETRRFSDEGRGRRWSLFGRRLLLWIGGSCGALLLVIASAGAVYRKNPELLPAWIANVIIPIQQLDPRPLPPSLVVMPFRGLGDDRLATLLADGISEGLTGALQAASEIRVVSSYSARALGEKAIAPKAAARELGVRYLLNGTVQKWGDRVHIEVALIDTEDGDRQICCAPQDRTSGNIIDLQRDITLEIFTSLKVTLTSGEEERISLAHGTRDLEAWLGAAQAEIRLRKLTPEDNAAAYQLYQRALARDANYAGAMVGLALTDIANVRFGWGSRPPEALLKEAGEYAQRAYAIDRDRSLANAVLGTLALISGDPNTAVAYGESAVRLDANDPDSAALLAYTLTYTGEPNRAINLVKKAMKLSPYYPDWYRWLLGRAHRLAGHDDEAVLWLQEDSSSSKESTVRLVELALAYVEAGRIGDAQGAAREALALNDRISAQAWIRAPRYSDSSVGDHELALLRAAGFPE